MRYVRSKAADDFLDLLRSSCASRKLGIPKGSIFWRARVGCEQEIVIEKEDAFTLELPQDRPYKQDGMKPIPNWQGEGRANPRGIPVLYMATTRNTALSEVRPWLGAKITVAQLSVERDLNLIDCSKHHNTSVYDMIDDGHNSKEDGIWLAIDRGFAAPANRDDESKDYLATQMIAELFKSEGYDGLLYKSLLSEDGFNVALFNLSDAKVINCSMFELASVNFAFKDLGGAVSFDN